MNLLFFLFLAPLLFLSVTAGAQPDSSGLQKPYSIKSCKIVYKFFDGPQNGNKTVIFDDWGRKEKEDVVMSTDTAALQQFFSGIRQEIAQTTPKSPMADSMGKAFGQEIPVVQHNMKLRIPGQVYAIDLDRMIGYKQEYFIMLPDSGFLPETEVGKDTILGKPCKIVEVQHAFRIWYWGKIALKREMAQKIEGMRIEEFAIEIDENYAIKPDEFIVPVSIKIQ
jgi:hypothetical protein